MTLQLEQLTLGYRHRPVIRQLTLPAIVRGSLVAVVGPNAVGKSTLLKGIAGLVPAKGSVSLDDLALLSLPSRQRLAKIGYLPQALPQRVPLVAYETVVSAYRSLGCGTSLGVDEAVERVFDTLGIRSLALRQLDQLSGGQRQMIGLAQVLVRRPPLMLLDEPTSALDLNWQLSVLQAVRNATDEQGAIALVASHDLNLALRFCDQLLILTPNGSAYLGEPDKLLTPERLHEAYAIEARVERCSLGQPIVLADRSSSTS